MSDPIQESYERYLAALQSCPGCGRVDEMDNIEGHLLCAACSLDQMSGPDETDYEEGS